MTDSARTPTLTPDILIFGGGIAGLWLINRLRERGYQCLLLETGTLGGAQTLASQGIIHGGLKYALGGGLSSESEAIAGMPDRWRAAIDGRDKVDLSGLRVLADTQNLWSTGSVASRMTSFFASKMLRGRIEKLKRDQFPSALANPRFKGQVYRLDDLVVDVPYQRVAFHTSVCHFIPERAISYGTAHADRLIQCDDYTDSQGE